MDFNNVIGQEETIERLCKLAQGERIPHALMLCGSSGYGSMALAMSFARNILVASATNKENAICMLKKWEHPDLHFVFPTIKLSSMSSDHQPISSDFYTEWYDLIRKTQYFTLTDWMNTIGATSQQAIITGAESDDIARKLSLKSSQGGYKVAIIWLPERMNQTSANKILKILEEPFSQTVFLLVSENPEMLLPTIKSRVQRIDIKKIESEAIQNALIHERGLEIDAASRITRLANGNWISATALLSADNEDKEFLQLFMQIMRLCYARDIKGIKNWTESTAGLGREKQRRLLTYFQKQIRENFMFNFNQTDLNYMSFEEEAFAQRFSKFINEKNIIELYELFERCYRDIGQNANAKIVFFDMALKIIVLLLTK